MDFKKRVILKIMFWLPLIVLAILFSIRNPEIIGFFWGLVKDMYSAVNTVENKEFLDKFFLLKIPIKYHFMVILIFIIACALYVVFKVVKFVKFLKKFFGNSK